MLTDAEQKRLAEPAHWPTAGWSVRLDADLIGECDMTLAEYEVLLHLADGPDDQRLRMNELADLARLSPSGLTRRFDALVRRGWVERERCDDDRRGVLARLTAGGRRAARRRPARCTTAACASYFFDLLDPERRRPAWPTMMGRRRRGERRPPVRPRTRAAPAPGRPAQRAR